MTKKTNITAFSLLGGILILSLGLFSCKDSSTGSIPEPSQSRPPHSGAMTASISFEVDNNCSVAIDSITIGMTGKSQNLSIAANSHQIFTVESDVISVAIYGQQVSANSATTCTLPNGTKVKVTWTGNIVVVDTLTLI